MKTLDPTATTTISERSWNSDQSWHRERVVVAPFGHRLRAYIRVNAYPFQSFGKVERWDGSAWHEVVRLPGVLLVSVRSKAVSYTTSDLTAAGTAALLDDETEMLREAAEVLGIEEVTP